jgi:hypothetical protein
MIENLNETLPGHRQRELHEQLTLLDQEIERRFHYPQERALAGLADSQGLGGHSSKAVRTGKRRAASSGSGKRS